METTIKSNQTSAKFCRCGCGEAVQPRRVFVNMEHQLRWMLDGGAREMGALQPTAAKALGGRVAGEEAARSGRLAAASSAGAARVREIASKLRQQQQQKKIES